MKSFKSHDHTDCISSNMTKIELYCNENGLKLTDLRKNVLRILLGKHKAMAAYDVLSQLKTIHPAAKPATVYRALDFLVSNAFAHKIERLNAYIACAHPGKDHAPAFMICRECDKVAETRAPRRDTPLHEAAENVGFHIEETVVEAQGICTQCKADADA